MAFGTGVGGFPLDEAARLMVGAAREHDGGLERIVFAVHGDEAEQRVPKRPSVKFPALVAPDSFKGTFSGAEVAAAVAAGLRDAGREAVELPVADGGEGTVEVLVRALGGELRTVTVRDPLGRPVEASFALLPDGTTAIVEVAAGERAVAGGRGGARRLRRLHPRHRRADRGRGRGRAPSGCSWPWAARPRPTAAPARSRRSTRPGSSRRSRCSATCARPSRTPRGCSGPQKGADPATVKRLERRLAELAEAAPRDPRGVPMTGAAGGLSGGLWAHRGAKLVPGAAHVLDAIGFDERMRAAAFVVTGEGRLDEQTLQGKIVGEVATRCRQGGVPCHAVVGREALDPFSERILDLASVTEAGTLDELRAAGRALVS